jgi:hypothetical protein
MVIAARILTLRQDSRDIEIPIRIFAPVKDGASWSCKFDVGWPEETWAMAAGGADSIQALQIAMQLIGAQIYASDHHAAGKLMWLEPGRGYGFPVPSGIRDLLVGNDRSL